MLSTIKNLSLFKIGWLACVISAAMGMPVFGIVAVICVMAVHLYDAPNARKELLTLGVAALMGLGWESLLVATGLVSYPGHEAAWIAPAWIVAMWVLFATTINRGLSWVKKHWMVAAAAGLLGGPMAFWGGSSLGAVTFEDPMMALIAIAVGWAALLPLLALAAEGIIDSKLFDPISDPELAPDSTTQTSTMRTATQAMSMLQSGSDIRS